MAVFYCVTSVDRGKLAEVCQAAVKERQRNGKDSIALYNYPPDINSTTALPPHIVQKAKSNNHCKSHHVSLLPLYILCLKLIYMLSLYNIMSHKVSLPPIISLLCRIKFVYLLFFLYYGHFCFAFCFFVMLLKRSLYSADLEKKSVRRRLRHS